MKHPAMFLALTLLPLSSCIEEADIPSIGVNNVSFKGKNYKTVSTALVEYDDYYNIGVFRYGVFINLEKGDYVQLTFLHPSYSFPPPPSPPSSAPRPPPTPSTPSPTPSTTKSATAPPKAKPE